MKKWLWVLISSAMILCLWLLIYLQSWNKETAYKINHFGKLTRIVLQKDSQNLVLQKQDDETFYAKMLDKYLANIDWNKSSKEIHNLVRGLNPWPIAYTDYKGERMKIYQTESLDEKNSNKPGTVLDVTKNGIKVVCGEGLLIIKKVQFPNAKPLTIEQYINGHEIEKNIILG